MAQLGLKGTILTHLPFSAQFISNHVKCTWCPRPKAPWLFAFPLNPTDAMTCRGPGDTSWRGVLVRLLVRQPKLRKTGYLEQTALLPILLVWLASNTSAPRFSFWNARTAGVHHSAQPCDVSFCVGDVAGAEDDASQNSANMESKKMQSLNQGRQTSESHRDLL